MIFDLLYTKQQIKCKERRNSLDLRSTVTLFGMKNEHNSET